MNATLNNLEQPEVIQNMQRALATSSAIAIPRDTAIEPIGDGNLVLTPGMITLLAAPVCVLATMLVGWLVLNAANIPLWGGEMIAGGIVNTVGGIAAALPLFLMMKKGSVGIAQAGILGIAVRIATILMGMLVAGVPAFGLSRMPLVYWVMGYYFPLLMVETGLVAWLSNKAKQ